MLNNYKNRIIMKKIILITFALFCIGLFTNCVKKKNCDCAMTGKFVYYNEPEKIFYCNNEIKVNAVFISEHSDFIAYIKDNIPSKFRKNDTIKVNICLKEKIKNGPCLGYGVGIIYKLKCIEEIE